MWWVLLAGACLICLFLIIEEAMAEPEEFRECEPKPLRNHRSGSVTLERGYELCRFAAWHREQMEGELEELCRMFGVGINEESPIRDWCIEVIFDGTLSLDNLITKVGEYQRELRSQA